MMKKTLYGILVICICVQISAGQTTDFKYLNPFFSGGIPLDSDNPIPDAVKTFITTFKSAVYSSSILAEIFDLSQFPADAFLKFIHDYTYQYNVDIGHSDPETVAKVASLPLGKGADAFTLPVTIGAYANSVARHIFANGILNPDNAVSLAMKYADSIEESAKRSWLKDDPKSKFKVLADGFVVFLSSLQILNLEQAADAAFHFGMEVQNAGKSYF